MNMVRKLLRLASVGILYLSPLSHGGTLYETFIDRFGESQTINLVKNSTNEFFTIGIQRKFPIELNSYPIVLRKYDASGKMIWEKQHGSTQYLYYGTLYSHLQPDGGIVTVSGTGSDPRYTVGIFKFSARGELEWKHLITRADDPKNLGVALDGDTLASDSDGNVIVAYRSGGNDEHTDYGVRAYSKTGQLLWSKIHSFGSTGGSLPGRLLIDSKRNIFIISKYNSYVLKLDSQGNILGNFQYNSRFTFKRALLTDDDKLLFLANDYKTNDLVVFDGAFRSVSLVDCRDINLHKDGTVWAGCFSKRNQFSLKRYALDGKILNEGEYSVSSEDYLTNPSVVVGDEGNVYVGITAVRPGTSSIFVDQTAHGVLAFSNQGTYQSHFFRIVTAYGSDGNWFLGPQVLGEKKLVFGLAESTDSLHGMRTSLFKLDLVP